MMHYIDNASINKAPLFIFSNGYIDFKHKILEIYIFIWRVSFQGIRVFDYPQHPFAGF